MTKEELITRLKSAERQVTALLDEVANLKEKLNKMQNDSGIPDTPVFERGADDWFVDETLATEHGYHSGNRDNGFNMFHTEEMAQLFADKCKLLAMMLHCKYYIEPDFVPNWDGDTVYHAVAYNIADKKFIPWFSRVHDWNTVYFSTEENARKCADWLNEHYEGIANV